MEQSAGTPKRPSPVRRLWAWITARHNTSLVFLLALSLGLTAVGVQVSQLWIQIVFAVVWGITFVALVGQFVGRRQAAQRARMA
ncbi:hypothetical protein [Kitasatospora camelliae]|uniref:Uncharacterized protein n=1 Tax=Kitasatospora camelliae TaxID=3156397 RepID=A0AAU8JS11_9ACTN